MLNCDNIVQNNTATQQTSFQKGNCAVDFFLSQKVVAVNPCRPVSRHHISITVCCTLSKICWHGFNFEPTPVSSLS